MIHVLVVSPIPAMRAGLRALLSADPDLVVAAAGDLGETALILGQSLPENTIPAPGTLEAGMSASSALSEEAPGGPAPLWNVLVVTQGSLDLNGVALPPEQALLLVTEDIQEAHALAGLGLRAWGVIAPDATAQALQTAVRALSEGLVAASPALIREVMAGMGSAILTAAAGETQDGSADPLTGRENDVLLRLAQGLTNKQIALALGISEHTVKFHVSSIYSKLGVSSRTEAVRKGARWGWVPL